MAITWEEGLEPRRRERPSSYRSLKESTRRAINYLQEDGTANPLETYITFPTGVNAITLTAGGSEYLNPPTVAIHSLGSSGGSGATATSAVTAGAVNYTVSGITLTANGSGYLKIPAGVSRTLTAPSVSITGVDVITTFTDDDIDMSTNVFTKTAHGMSNTNHVHLTTDNILPYGLYETDELGNIFVNPDFYVINSTTDTFQLSKTSGGTSVDIKSRSATATVILSTKVGAGESTNNMVIGVNVPDGGWGYTTAPTVTFSAPPEGGTTATGTAVLGDGEDNKFVNKVDITNYGSGYITTPTVTFTGGFGTFSIRNGGGATATAVVGHGATAIPNTNTTGVVTGVTMLTNGSNYINTTVIIKSAGNTESTGSGATATATIGSGAITAVNVTAGGTSYASLQSLSAKANSAITDPVSIDKAVAVIESAIIAQWIHSGGSGYTSAPGVSFAGGGTGAAGTASVSGGEVVSVSVTSGGSGYSEPTTVSFSGGGGSGASATAILSSGSVSSVSFVDLPVAWVNAGYTSGDAASVKAAVDGYITKCTEAEAAIASLLAQINVSSAGNFLEHNEMLCGLLPARFTPAPAKKAFESIKAIGSSVMTIKDVCGVEYENYMEKLFGTLLNGDDTINTCRANLNINPLSAGTYALLTITTRMIAASSNAVTLIAEIAAIQVPLAAWILIINGDTGAFNTLRTTDEAELVAAEAFIAYFARGQRDIGYWGEDFDIFLYTDILGSRKSLQILTDRENGTIA